MARCADSCASIGVRRRCIHRNAVQRDGDHATRRRPRLCIPREVLAVVPTTTITITTTTFAIHSAFAPKATASSASPPVAPTAASFTAPTPVQFLANGAVVSLVVVVIVEIVFVQNVSNILAQPAGTGTASPPDACDHHRRHQHANYDNVRELSSIRWYFCIHARVFASLGTPVVGSQP